MSHALTTFCSFQISFKPPTFKISPKMPSPRRTRSGKLLDQTTPTSPLAAPVEVERGVHAESENLEIVNLSDDEDVAEAVVTRDRRFDDVQVVNVEDDGNVTVVLDAGENDSLIQVEETEVVRNCSVIDLTGAGEEVGPRSRLSAPGPSTSGQVLGLVCLVV